MHTIEKIAKAQENGVKTFGLAEVILFPPDENSPDGSSSSPQICGGQTWKDENESIQDFATRILKFVGTDEFNSKEIGCELWVIGFEDQTNPSEEPQLIHKLGVFKW